MSEHDHQVYVFDILRLNESRDERLKWIYAIPNGGHRHSAVAGKLKAEGVKKGISDICLPFPSGGWHGAYLELKDGVRKATDDQIAFLGFVVKHGYYGEVVYSGDEALNAIERYCEIKLRGRK